MPYILTGFLLSQQDSFMYPISSNQPLPLAMAQPFSPHLVVPAQHYPPHLSSFLALQSLYCPNYYFPLPCQEDSHSNLPASTTHLTESASHQPSTACHLKEPLVKHESTSATAQPQPHSAQVSSQLKVVPSTRRSKGSNDGEYRPNRPERRVVRKRVHENANRNILPNQLHQIVSFLVKKNRSGRLLRRVMEQHPSPIEDCSEVRFYLYMGVLKERIAQTGSQQGVMLLGQQLEPEGRVWPQGEQDYYCRLVRVMVRHFLKEEGVCGVLTSKRMVASRRRGHLEIGRQLEARVLKKGVGLAAEQ